MRRLVIVTMLAGCSMTATGVRAGASEEKVVGRTPVLVELFTSEGCSSCPPADRLLKQLDSRQPVPGAEIIVLGEHVDYWDGLGWHDRFSSPAFTARQQAYAQRMHLEGAYTPQMVVNGRDQFVGSDGRQALRAIAQAAEKMTVRLVLSEAEVDGRSVRAGVSAGPGSGLGADGGGAGEVYAALVDREDLTEVRGGENGGTRLTHAGVVRVLRRVGTLKDLGAGPIRFAMAAPADADLRMMRVVVFAAREGQGEIVGAALREITPKTTGGATPVGD